VARIRVQAEYLPKTTTPEIKLPHVMMMPEKIDGLGSQNLFKGS